MGVPTVRELNSERTRARIIEAATRLFAKKGFFGTSVSDLAAETAMTKGALYHHFRDKEDLFLAVVESVRNAWQKGVIRNVIRENDAVSRFETLFESHTQLINSNVSLCLVMSSLVAVMEDLSPDLAQAVRKTYGDLDDFVEGIITSGMEEGTFRTDIDARLAAHAAVEILKSACSHLHGRSPEERTARMDVLKRIFLDGLRR